jgi:tetratricopeptide (TPR) repeat protein
MASASTQVTSLPIRGRTVETVSREAWNLARIEALESLPRAERASGAALAAPTLEETLALSDEIAGLSRSEPARALRLAQSFVELARATSDRATFAVARRCRGHMFRRLGQFRGALRDYDSARVEFQRLGLKLEAACTAIGTVDALGHMGRDEDARTLATKARRVFASAGEAGRAARLDVNLGLLSERSGKPREALAAYRRAEAIFQRQNAVVDLALTRFNHANALVSLDRYHEALALYRSSAEVCRSRGVTTTLCRCQLAIGSVLFRLGRLDEAMGLLEETSEMANSLDNPELTATAALDLARAELLMERLDSVGVRLDTAIQDFESLAMHADRAESLGLRGSLRLKLGQVEEALADWRRAGQIYRGIGHRAGAAWADFWHAEALARLGRVAESRTFLRSALRPLQRRGSAVAELEARLLLAEQEVKRRPQEARRQLELVAHRMRTLRDPWIAYRLSVARALLARRVGAPQKARRELERAYTVARRLQSLLPMEALQAQWLGRRDELFDLALDPELVPVAAPANRSARAATTSAARARWMLLWSERARAPRASWGGIADAGEAGQVGADADLTAFQATREELHWLDARERARRFVSPGDGRADASTRDLVTWRRKRTQALARLERHGKRLELRAARQGRLGTYAEPDPAAIQEALADDEALLEFFVRDREIVTFIVSRRAISAAASSHRLEESREAAVRLRQLWDRHRLGSGFISRHGEALTRTATLLFGQLRESLLDAALPYVPSGVSRLVVSPHCWLRNVPFHAMAGDGWDLRYALSGQSLVAGMQGGSTARAEGPALIVGVSSADAPRAEQEARAVAREHPGSTLLLGDDATHEAVRARWSDARIIHVAAHGGIQAADPRLSGLPLAGGTWSVHEMRAVETRADLVVLSSCQSGETVLWGNHHQIGLLPALFEGGAGAAIVSLWPADDETTSILMSVFHHELAAGRSFGEALRSARRVVRGVKPSPYYWAPFVLYGADRRGGTRS